MNLSKIRVLLRKLFSRKTYAYAAYISYYKKLKIEDDSILLESRHGETFDGQIYYIAKELANNNEYDMFKIYLSSSKENIKKFENILRSNKINNIIPIECGTRKYYKLLASVKYLINDTSFKSFFVKKDGQIYLNTWHGTPLKTLGKKVKNDFQSLGNVQRNFLLADYLLYPNVFTMNHMIEDYMLENIATAKVLLSGYPRNIVFFDDIKRKEVKNELNLKDKEIFVYLPTWRGVVGNSESNASSDIERLKYIDQNLKTNQLLFIQFHPLDKKQIDYSLFKNIRSLPSEYEIYEFLNIADCLITDYSSVLFDFAITKKKIILFAYDESEYFADRGVYIGLDELPFPKVSNVKELLKEMNTSKKYDDKKFLADFCSYDNTDAIKTLCDRVILGKDNGIEEHEIPRNGKENILIYAGGLEKNGITSALLSLLSLVDIKQKNYYVVFRSSSIDANKNVLLNLPVDVNYIGISGRMNSTLFQLFCGGLYYIGLMNTKQYLKISGNPYKYDAKRLFGNSKFSRVIHFTGYEIGKIILFSQVDAKRIIYVHSNMVAEMKTRKNSHKKTLEYAYENYDKVAIVSEDIREYTKFFCENDNNFHVSENLIDYKTILEKANQNIQFDDTTDCNLELNELLYILNNKKAKVFINIGRFSPEKGHKRLIDCFDKLSQQSKEPIYLIIIGGHGKEYGSTLEYAQSKRSYDNIIIIKSISNPFPILKKCNYFVLSSTYESLGLVMLEADVLGLPVISTNIKGPRKFMEENGGTLVENSNEGIYQGMELLLKNKVKAMKVDYKKYNQQGLEQFLNLIDK